MKGKCTEGDFPAYHCVLKHGHEFTKIEIVEELIFDASFLLLNRLLFLLQYFVLRMWTVISKQFES
jgi:hypothetical protein